MLYKELETKPAKELKRILAEQRANLHQLRLQTAVNQLKNVREIRKTKRTVARILTRLQELKLTQEVPAKS